MTIMPAIIVSFASIALDIVTAVLTALAGGDMTEITMIFAKMAISGYMVLFIVGAITTVTQWRNIYASTLKKVLYTFTFPLFMFTYIPISVSAIFGRVQWKPIVHDHGSTVAEITGSGTAA